MERQNVPDSNISQNEDCRLIFTRKTERHSACIRVDRNGADNVNWMSIFFGPEEVGKGWSVSAKLQDALLEKVVSHLIPVDYKVYALLDSTFAGEIGNLAREIRSSGLLSNVPESRIGRLKFHLGSSIKVEAAGKNIPEWFRKYGGWTILPWYFLVSRKILKDWMRKLNFYRIGSRIGRQLLQQVEFLMFNHYDDGIEIVSSSIGPDRVQLIAQELAREFQIPLEVQQKGDPHGKW